MAGVAARITDAPQNSFAESAVAYSDEIAFRCIGIVVVHAARAVRSIGGRSADQTAKRIDDDWSGA